MPKRSHRHGRRRRRSRSSSTSRSRSSSRSSSRPSSRSSSRERSRGRKRRRELRHDRDRHQRDTTVLVGAKLGGFTEVPRTIVNFQIQAGTSSIVSAKMDKQSTSLRERRASLVTRFFGDSTDNTITIYAQHGTSHLLLVHNDTVLGDVFGWGTEVVLLCEETVAPRKAGTVVIEVAERPLSSTRSAMDLLMHRVKPKPKPKPKPVPVSDAIANPASSKRAPKSFQVAGQA